MINKRELAAQRLALGVGGSVGEYLQAKRECPHCNDSSRQRKMTDAERGAVTGPASNEVRNRKEVYKCWNPVCGCIYDKSTGTKLTFG